MTGDLVPPALRNRLGELRLTSRHAIGVQGIGLHRSRSRGAGLEFSQYRGYEPGDDLRQVDWKLYARSDRFFVREAERESPLDVWILVDASGSMAQADGERPQWSRLDAARCLAACVGELALRQGDRFGLAGLHEGGLRLLAPGSGTRQRDRLQLELRSLQAGGRFPSESMLAPLWERIGRRDLVLLLGDCFDEASVMLAERLAAARREVLVIQLLTVEERDFPFRGGHRFRDPETGEELLGDGTAMRADYLARMARALETLDARFDAAGIRHARHVLDQPPDQVLRQLFGSPLAAEYA